MKSDGMKNKCGIADCGKDAVIEHVMVFRCENHLLCEVEGCDDPNPLYGDGGWLCETHRDEWYQRKNNPETFADVDRFTNRAEFVHEWDSETAVEESIQSMHVSLLEIGAALLRALARVSK